MSDLQKHEALSEAISRLSAEGNAALPQVLGWLWDDASVLDSACQNVDAWDGGVVAGYSEGQLTAKAEDRNASAQGCRNRNIGSDLACDPHRIAADGDQARWWLR
jgi:hypothetical protein